MLPDPRILALQTVDYHDLLERAQWAMGIEEGYGRFTFAVSLGARTRDNGIRLQIAGL